MWRRERRSGIQAEDALVEAGADSKRSGGWVRLNVSDFMVGKTFEHGVEIVVPAIVVNFFHWAGQPRAVCRLPGWDAGSQNQAEFL